MKRLFSSAGFTLLEVLIALGILAISLVGMYTAQGNSLLASASADQLTVATLLANQQMTEWKFELQEALDKKSDLDDKEESGDFEAPYEDFHWMRKVRKVEIPIMLPESGDDQQDALMQQAKGVLEQVAKAVREVTVRVYWGEADNEEEYVLTTHTVNMAGLDVLNVGSSDNKKDDDSKSDEDASPENNTSPDQDGNTP